MNVKEIQLTAQKAWPFEASSYPLLVNLDNDQDRQAFALKHVLIHMMKVTGKLSNLVEPLDHGLGIERGEILSVLCELIIDSIQFAELAGISADDLEAEVCKWQAHVVATTT